MKERRRSSANQLFIILHYILTTWVSPIRPAPCEPSRAWPQQRQQVVAARYSKLAHPYRKGFVTTRNKWVEAKPFLVARTWGRNTGVEEFWFHHRHATIQISVFFMRISSQTHANTAVFLFKTKYHELSVNLFVVFRQTDANYSPFMLRHPILFRIFAPWPSVTTPT